MYIEYAFLEKELNQNDVNCVKILETALLMHPIKKHFHSLTIKNCITQLYRVFVELLLISGKKYVKWFCQKIIKDIFHFNL